MAVAAGLILSAAPGLTRAQSAPPAPVQIPMAHSPSAQAQREALPEDDFAGFTYTDEQKTEIEKIRQDTKTHEAVVAKDDKLTVDQKDAMLTGYRRLEFGRIYRVLTPEQRREVNQRIRARRAADQVAKSKQTAANQNANAPAK